MKINVMKINFKILMVCILCVIELIAVLNLNSGSQYAIVELAVITISIILLILFFKCFLYSVDIIVDNSEKLYRGELNIDDIIIDNNSEFKTLAKSINSLKSNLLFFIDQIKKTTIDLSTSFQICSQNIEVSGLQNEKIKNLMENVSKNTQDQLEIVNESFELINTISASIEKISVKINDIQDAVSDLNSTSQNVMVDVNNYSDNIEVISNNMEDAIGFLKTFEGELSEITKVVDFISDISEQLKLLSLNASIESARSGEAGKGFSVIAGEITELSNVTNDGIRKINEFIKNILKNSKSVENSINLSMDNVQAGNKTFHEIKQIINNYEDENNKILYSMEQVSKEMYNIESVVKKNTLLSEKITSSTKMVSEQASDVYNIAEKVSMNNDKIDKASEEVMQVANKFKSLVSIFKIGVVPMPNKSNRKIKIGMIIVDKNRGFWLTVKLGALYAKNELENYNTDVDILYTDPVATDETLIDTLKCCIDKKPDGICILANREQYIPIIDKAYDDKIYTITYNNDFKGQSKRIACVQQDQYESGIVAGQELARQLDKKGNVAIFRFFEYPDSERICGFKEAIKKYKNINIVDTICDNLDEEESIKIFEEYLKNNIVDGIFFTARYKLRFGEIIEKCNLQNKIKVIVYDSCPVTLKYVKNRTFSGIINQDGFGQGHDPIVSMYNYLIGEKKIKERISSRIELINEENVNNYLV